MLTSLSVFGCHVDVTMMGVGNSDVLPGYLGTSVPGYLGGTWVPTCDNNHMGHVPGYLPVNLKSQVPGTWVPGST